MIRRFPDKRQARRLRRKGDPFGMREACAASEREMRAFWKAWRRGCPNPWTMSALAVAEAREKMREVASDLGGALIVEPSVRMAMEAQHALGTD